MARIKDDLKELRGPEKAAAFMLAIGETHAAQLFKMMDEEEVRTLSSYMAQLGPVSPTAVEGLLKGFSEQISASGTLIGGYEATERLLAKTLDPQRVSQIMQEIRGPSGRTMWDKLANVNEAVLANYLKNEYPQTAAVVLSKVKPAHASRVLAQLPETFAMDVITRMLRMENVQKDVLANIERVLRDEFVTNLARPNRPDSRELLAEIFNNFDRGTEARLMGSLEKLSPEYAEQIKALMFTFEDLQRLQPAAVQTLLRNVPKEQLTIALKGASEALKALFLNNMSERAAKMIRDDLVAMGPVRLRDVDSAQGAIVAVAKTLAESGEIVIGGQGGDNEELVD